MKVRGAAFLRPSKRAMSWKRAGWLRCKGLHAECVSAPRRLGSLALRESLGRGLHTITEPEGDSDKSHRPDFPHGKLFRTRRVALVQTTLGYLFFPSVTWI